jgi:hypothetical protein
MMNQYTKAYQNNNKYNLKFKDAIAKIFLQCAASVDKITSAIHENNIEIRYSQSERLVFLLSEIYKVFSEESNLPLSKTMQNYCTQNMTFVAKINLNNDIDLAESMKQSFMELAATWQAT